MVKKAKYFLSARCRGPSELGGPQSEPFMSIGISMTGPKYLRQNVTKELFVFASFSKPVTSMSLVGINYD